MSKVTHPRPAAQDTIPEPEGQSFAVAAPRTLADNRGENIAVIDLRGISGLADFIVIGTGTSNRQMHAALAHVEELAHGVGRRPFKTADSSTGQWLLADYVDVVVHMFDAEHRDYYDLDGLWGDAPRVAWETNAGPHVANG